ncbi:hypothetical protein Celaphus_00017660 [Cervus elaphus hippelaphus]|uniref:Secreted protein n=1 Tax=Cervus elaphus hippelaphus TaxID=46360 RepID=A0A212C728_CEREH|nr:hypothetical protein Celaphus_00017660 [Cervus elaphus hippelaphus]
MCVKKCLVGLTFCTCYLASYLTNKAIPVFLTLHNAAEVIICGHQKCFRKEKTSPAKICSVVLLTLAAHPTECELIESNEVKARISVKSGLRATGFLVSGESQQAPLSSSYEESKRKMPSAPGTLEYLERKQNFSEGICGGVSATS